MKKLIILTTFFLITSSVAMSQENTSESKGKTPVEIKKESIETVKDVKKKTEGNIKDINGEVNENEKVQKKEENQNDEEKTQTLVSNRKNRTGKKLSLGGYFAPVFRFSQVNTDEYSTFIGYKGAFMIEGFGIGTGMFINADSKKRNIKDKNRRVYMGYGGLLLEYNFLKKKIVNFSVGTIVGIGTAGYIKTVYYDDGYYDDRDERYIGTTFFVLEPELVLYINVTKFFRIGIGGSYRYVNGLERYNLDDDTYAGFAGSLIFQFGWF